MKGRKVFRIAKYALKSIAYVFKYSPKFVVGFIWSVVSPFSGYVAVGLRFSICRGLCESVGDNVYPPCHRSCPVGDFA